MMKQAFESRLNILLSESLKHSSGETQRYEPIYRQRIYTLGKDK